MFQRVLTSFGGAAWILLSISSAHSQPAMDLDKLKHELQILRAEQAELAERVERLENLLAVSHKEDDDDLIQIRSPLLSNELSRESPSPGHIIFGDLRTRFEVNRSEGALPNRDRGSLRGRITARSEITNKWNIGARLVTGNLDDPNSTDVTVGGFNNDLDIGLDQLFVTRSFGPIDLFIGKFPRIYTATDLVWDGDITLQGLGIDFSSPLARGAVWGARASVSSIDENAEGADSILLGGQVSFERVPLADLQLSGALGYYDYSLDGFPSADLGDFRTNLLSSEGRYASDFDLVDINAGIDVPELLRDWPLSVQVNWAQNLSAFDDEDTAWRVAAILGQLDGYNPVALTYAYSDVERDAVFAAFSNDNLTIATGYQSHEWAGLYRLSQDLDAQLIVYRFRDGRPISRLERLDEGEWQTRIRANLIFRF